MIGFLGDAYPWIKAAHLVFVIFWMAGLFMLPRFYAYHQEAQPGSVEWARWTAREARLIQIILNPAIVMVWALGLMLLINIGVAGERWFQAKFAVAMLLSAYHGWMVSYARRLVRDERLVSPRTMRLLNEVPGIAAIVIVVLVIVRPL